MSFQLAQVNVARLMAPLDDPATMDFVAALDPVNAAADHAPGFQWRLQTEEGNATEIDAFSWDTADSVGMIVNLSVWTDVEHLAAFVYGEMHRQVLRRRREWFQPTKDAFTACWWVPAGQRPTTEDAENRIRLLRRQGPTQYAFTLREHYPAPDNPDNDRRDEMTRGADDWLDPAQSRP
jgi:Domain of unknown function (DUF3291)